MRFAIELVMYKVELSIRFESLVLRLSWSGANYW